MQTVSSEHDVISENFNIISKRCDTFDSLKDSQIFEIIDSILPELRKSDNINEAIKVATRKYREYSSFFSVNDSVSFCRRLSEKLSDCGHDPSELIFSGEELYKETKIAYVENQYSKQAYSLFSEYVPHPESFICHSFTDMCDEIGSGICDACILPIENTSDGKLLSFYSLIDRYDLKILLVCDIENENGTQRTRYALLEGIIHRPQANFKSLYYEFNYSPAEQLSVGAALSAATECKLSLYRIDSIPLRYNESSFIIHFILCGATDNIITYIIYLAMNLSQFTTIGVCGLIPE